MSSHKLIIMKYLLIALPLFVTSCGGNSTGYSDAELDRMADEMVEKNYGIKPKGKSKEELQELSEYCAQEQVKNNLKSPTTAEFNTKASVSSYNDTTFIVSGTVDSQNGFGAMIRSNYSCIITFTGRGENYNMSLMSIE